MTIQSYKLYLKKIGGNPDNYERFVRDFYKDKKVRQAAYHKASINPENFDNIESDIMGGSQQKTISLPLSIERKPMKNEPVSVMAPTPELQEITTNYFGKSENNKIDLPILTTKGVEVRSIPNNGEFGQPYKEGKSVFVEYSNVRHVNDELNFTGLGITGLRDKDLPSKHHVYVGPTEEFMHTYNSMSEEERQNYFRLNSEFKEEVKRASLMELNNIMGVTDEHGVEDIIIGGKSNFSNTQKELE